MQMHPLYKLYGLLDFTDSLHCRRFWAKLPLDKKSVGGIIEKELVVTHPARLK